MLAARRIGPFACGATSIGGSEKANIKTSAGTIMDVSDHPIATFAAAIREITPTHGLGVFAKAARNFSGNTGHMGLQFLAARFRMTLSSSDAQRTAPTAPAGDE